VQEQNPNKMPESTPQTDFDFGIAIMQLKAGKKLCRSGWNGKGMYVTMKPGYPNGVPANAATAKSHDIPEGTTIFYRPYLEMKTVDNQLVPWVISQSDALAEDWQIVN
jgi:hypothetical protein